MNFFGAGRAWLPVAMMMMVAMTVAEGAADDDAQKTALAVAALSRLQGVDINANAKLKEAVLRVLERTRGTANFVKLVQQFKLPGQEPGLLEVAAAEPASESGVEAMRLVLGSTATALIQDALAGTNGAVATRIAEALGNTSERSAVPFLLRALREDTRDLALRKQFIRSLVRTSAGADEVLKLAREDKLAEGLKFTAAAELNGVRWPEIRTEAARLFPPLQGQNAAPLPPISELVKAKGDAVNGSRIFFRTAPGCGNCHVVGGRGVEFGPNLSEIGTKLGKDAMFEAILEPSAGVSFGFEAWSFTLKNGDEAYGLLASETAEEVAVKAVGGVVTRLKKSDVESRQQSRLSIMPTGLQAAMTTQELVDLVEYLATLKKP